MLCWMSAESSKVMTGLVLDRVFQKHDPGPGHPEQVARYVKIVERLEGSGLAKTLREIPVDWVDEKWLQLVHEPSYIELASREIRSGKGHLSTGDTQVCLDSLEAAMMAVGGALNAVDAVIEGEVRNAFCAVRPPGHHASQARGMGFCVFNTIAVAARYAQRRHGLKRVAIVDWDVHHGNGTQDVFYEDPTVHFFSTHQWPLYPGTGAATELGRGEGRGSTLNCPFPAGSGMKEIREAFEKAWVPAMDVFQPEMIFVSAGFDSRVDDPLGAFTLTDNDFGELTQGILRIANTWAKGRVVSCLEGGYNVEGLALAVEAHVRALASA